MSNTTISVRQGSTETIPVEIDDEQAVSVRLVVKADPQDISPLIDPEPSATFVGGVASIEVSSADTLGISPGDYLYQFVVIYEDDTEVIYTGVEDCDCEDGCELPTFQVCESLSTGAIS